MEEVIFENINDLYTRVYPALSIKKRNLKAHNIDTKEEVIWNYLVRNKWNNNEHLELHSIVDDILNFDVFEYIEKSKE